MPVFLNHGICKFGERFFANDNSMTMKRKKIVFVINTLVEGGAAKMVKHVASIESKECLNVSIISIFDTKADTLLEERIKQVPLGMNVKGLFLWRIKTILSIRKVLKVVSPDVVCSFISDVCFYSRVASFGLNIKVVSAERGDPFTNGGIWGRITKWTYSKSDYCFFQLERARDFYGEKVTAKSFVIPNAFPRVEIREPYTGERRKTVVSVGRLFEYQKQFGLLIRAFKQVYEKHPDYILIIYGEGQDRKQLQDLIHSLGLKNAASLPGAIKNPINVIREAGVFVLSSNFEGIPNSLIEALASGIPTVSTDCSPGGPAFLTHNGENGLLIPIGDEKAMADAICQVIENPELANQLSQKGIQVIEELDESRISKCWTDAFETILSS